MSGLYGFPKNGCLGPNDDVKFMQKANNIEFPCENSPHQVNIWVEKGTKAKEVTPELVFKIVKISCCLNNTVAVT